MSQQQRISADMTPEEEHRALVEKTAELKQVTDEMEVKIATMPYDERTAPMREMMEQMLAQLRRMDKNLRSMIRISEEQQIKGGTDNGSY